MQLPFRVTESRVDVLPPGLRGRDPREAAFLVLRNQGKLVGLTQLASVLSRATGATVPRSQLGASLSADPRFSRYGPDLWGLRAVGLDGAVLHHVPSNGEIGQGAVVSAPVTAPLFYGCPVAPESLTIVDEEGSAIRDARAVRLIGRYVLTGLRAWMQREGFSYEGRSSLLLTIEDFTKGIFKLSHRETAKLDSVALRGLGDEFASVMGMLLRGHRGLVNLYDLLPLALYLWPGRGAGPCDPFETVLRTHAAFQVRPGGDVKLSRQPSPRISAGCDYLLHFYDVSKGMVRATVEGAAPCPCGSGKTFGKCCRRAKPR
jgi:hypothetical protein